MADATRKQEGNVNDSNKQFPNGFHTVVWYKRSNEYHVFKNIIEYRRRHWKGITIYNANEVYLQQKGLF